MAPRLALRSAALAAGVAAVLTLTACGGDTEESGKPSIVASTDVWGSVAEAVAGPDAEVEALIDDPSADPHSHESSAGETAHIADADLVVLNGGGYDEFVEQALSGRSIPSVDAYELRPDKAEENEHVWYDVATVAAVADAIATELGALDSGNAQAYTDRATEFTARLAGITAVTDRIAAARPDTPVLQTEPLAYYLLNAARVRDLTPPEFQEAIEQETDPAPAAVATTRDLLTGRQVGVLVYNVQTEDQITRDLRGLAQQSGIPVLEVAETLPEGVDYLTWQTANAEALAAAVGA